MAHVSGTGHPAWRHDTMAQGAVPFATLRGLRRSIGNERRPVLEIIFDADRGVLGSIESLS
jgi:hypothetical protein